MSYYAHLGSRDYDLCLLRLKNPVNFTTYPHVSPACLPTKDEPPSGCDVRLYVFINLMREKTIKYYFKMLVSGWGRDHTDVPGSIHVLQKVRILRSEVS